MKRTPLTRKTPLRAKTPLKSGGELKHAPLGPVSKKGREKRLRDAEQARVEGAAFRAAIHGQRCVMCGRTEQEAYDVTGYSLQSHHPVRQQVLERLGRVDIRFAPELAVPLCEEPCHRRHTSRKQRVPFEKLPVRVVEFCNAQGLADELLREHPHL